GQPEEGPKQPQELILFARKHPGNLFHPACGVAWCPPAVTSDPLKSPPTNDQVPKSDYADQALAALRQAVASGFKDTKALETNPDLEPLRSYPAYKDFLNQIAKR